MVVLKQLVGQYEGPNNVTSYYMIQKGSFYGVEIVDEKDSTLTSTYEWFSENREETLTFVQSLYKCNASGLHLSELVDDYVS